MPKSAHGSGTDVFKTLVDDSLSTWALSSSSLVAGVRGYAVNKGGVDTAFPQNRCRQLWYHDGVMFGFKIKDSWWQYNGTTWVPAIQQRDM